MIIINLKGGIGNQMFQYAFGKKMALKNDDTLKLETAGLARANDVGDIYRPFSLDAFQIQKNIATPDEVRKLKYPYGIISKGLRWFNFKILKKRHTVFEQEALSWTGDLFLDGYWQSPLYFDDIRKPIVAEFQLRTPLSTSVMKYKTRMESTNSISVHIRRGDYVKNPQVLKEFGICEASYYQAAIDQINASTDNPTFFVFSDDIAWVKENLPLPATSVFVQDPDLRDVEELALMSMCKHNIIANSTFSWWGAYLNNNDEKIVIAPTPWFNESKSDPHLIPETWTQLPKA